jgi:hypothetical protein
MRQQGGVRCLREAPSRRERSCTGPRLSPRFRHSGGAEILPEWLRTVGKRIDLSKPERWKRRIPWRIAQFRELTSPPHPAEQGVWSASKVTARDGGYTFAAAPNAATSDAAIHHPHSMPVPTRVPSVTLL